MTDEKYFLTWLRDKVRDDPVASAAAHDEQNYLKKGFEMVYNEILTEQGGLTVRLKADYTGESPNDRYKVWQRDDVAREIMLPRWFVDNSPHFTNRLSRLDDLARTYKARGHKTPLADAYDTLSRQLLDDLYGSLLQVEVVATFRGVTLYRDEVLVPYSPYRDTRLEDVVESAAAIHFADSETIVTKAADAARLLANQLNSLYWDLQA